MNEQGLKEFIRGVFCDKGQPSSARIMSTWMGFSSMALIWWMVKHAMNLDREATMIWVSGLPAIIYALAAFSVSPFCIGKITAIWDKAPFGPDEKKNHPRTK